ncbi:MAG: hypothetical protein KUL77_10085, partial [Thermomonas sp.]|uniref:hypothetical protein n=1 Tax=Thermomonas sp. TaxID=1971895 RepID=UPI001EB7D6F4
MTTDGGFICIKCGFYHGLSVISFETDTLDAVVVQGGNFIQSIDVSQTDTRTVFTAEQLKELALPRDINAVAL